MSITKRLRADLVAARTAGDATEVSMIRTLIAAIENAQAVPIEKITDPGAEPKVGLGHDLPRRALTDEDVRRIVGAERAEVAAAAAHYRHLGLSTETADMERRVEIVDRYLGPLP